jgi:hypothetical protein
MLPLGYTLVAAFPEQRLVGLHVVFIGGFWLMAMTIGSHVALSHGGAGARTRNWNWQLISCALLLLIAIITRAFVNLDPTHVLRWMAIAAGAFLLATLPWAALVLPVLTRSGPVEPR